MLKTHEMAVSTIIPKYTNKRYSHNEPILCFVKMSQHKNKAYTNITKNWGNVTAHVSYTIIPSRRKSCEYCHASCILSLANGKEKN